MLDETAQVWYDGNVWRTASSPAADNHLINGTFRLWQRDTTHDLPAKASTALYTVDRWAIVQTATAQGLQVSQISGSPTLRISRPEAQPPPAM